MTKKNICFCTLALGVKYHALAGRLAESMQKYAGGFQIIVLTDNPEFFYSHKNVQAFKHRQVYTLKPYNDKIFVLRKALELFEKTIFIDADTFFAETVPGDIYFPVGVISNHFEDLFEHVKRYTPERLRHYKDLALKMGITIERTQWVGESLLGLSRDSGREKFFWTLGRKWQIILN